MKLAILGSSPQALEFAIRFHQYGAALTWFNCPEDGPEEFQQELLSTEALISDLGVSLLKSLGKEYAPKKFSWQVWKNDYYAPLSSYLATQHRVRQEEVVSVSKRFLAPGEEIAERDRFYDLFRVIFQMNPQDFIQQQQASNPETFERLSEEFKNSLQSHIEMYEDFDVVIDLRRSNFCSSLSVTGRALGEGRISRDHLIYGWQALREAQRIAQQPNEIRELAVVGSGELAALIVLALKDWCLDQRMRLFVVTTEATPFADYLTHGPSQRREELRDFLSTMEQDFEREVSEFHLKLRQWQELDDFIQAKISRPVEPIPRLVYFSGHNATAVDQLIDKRRVFLTLEKPDFREGLKQAENNALDLKTIGVDKILVATPFKKRPLEVYLNPKEKGHFSLELSHWERDLIQMKGIEDEIFKLFSPASSQ
jgi:hypothetical protein